MRTLALVLAGVLGGCVAPPAPRAIAIVEPPPIERTWRDSASDEDAALIDALDTAWTRALAASARRGRAVIATEGALLDRSTALGHHELSPGSYTCRAVRLDASGARAFPEQFCFVKGEPDGRLSFNKQTGSDLPNGWLFLDGDRRYIFLGAQQRRAGENNLGYGVDRTADRVGVIERIGPFRWRLAMPRRDGSFWVYELTPVPAERQPG
jgi:hypothetical protein